MLRNRGIEDLSEVITADSTPVIEGFSMLVVAAQLAAPS